MDQSGIDEAVQRFYRDADEGARLTSLSAAGAVEFERTQSLLRARIAPSSRIIDIGGATGIHATWLAADGHEVVLIDPVPTQVAQASAIGSFAAETGDARDLRFDACSFDVALLFGPLYHLRSRSDRLRALREAVRVVRPGGLVFAAGISRFSALADGMLRPVPEAADERILGLINTGDWDASGPFPIAHLHTTAELESELADAGLSSVESVCVEGPLGLALEHLAPGDGELHRAALLAAERLGGAPCVKETGPHLLAWGGVPQ
ncbi:MAG: class I SAM-dependent methyltransferase [Propionibacteriaceae bacterium]|nr:class I SAM-dependent methyltransferase [Propionibacteriaceae bacterium]